VTKIFREHGAALKSTDWEFNTWTFKIQ